MLTTARGAINGQAANASCSRPSRCIGSRAVPRRKPPRLRRALARATRPTPAAHGFQGCLNLGLAEPQDLHAYHPSVSNLTSVGQDLPLGSKHVLETLVAPPRSWLHGCRRVDVLHVRLGHRPPSIPQASALLLRAPIRLLVVSPARCVAGSGSPRASNAATHGRARERRLLGEDEVAQRTAGEVGDAPSSPLPGSIDEMPRRYAERCGLRPEIGATGFEPATFRPPAECATRLRHAPRSRRS